MQMIKRKLGRDREEGVGSKNVGFPLTLTHRVSSDAIQSSATHPLHTSHVLSVEGLDFLDLLERICKFTRPCAHDSCCSLDDKDKVTGAWYIVKEFKYVILGVHFIRMMIFIAETSVPLWNYLEFALLFFL